VPLYEYQCAQCGRFEVIRKFSDPPLSVCPTCGSEIQKLLSAPAIQFKGTGWYITDYARKSSGSGGGDKKGGEQKTESKTESTSDSKSDSKDGGGKSESSDSTSTKTPSKTNSA
jgi:putative FmdB family regulatory protein